MCLNVTWRRHGDPYPVIMTSWHGNHFRITDPLYKGSLGAEKPPDICGSSAKGLVMRCFSDFFVVNLNLFLTRQSSGRGSESHDSYMTSPWYQSWLRKRLADWTNYILKKKTPFGVLPLFQTFDRTISQIPQCNPHIPQHFVAEICACVHISVTKWCIVGYLSDELWDLWDLWDHLVI